MTLTATLSLADLQLIKESLLYTKLKFEDYANYPSQDFKQKRIEEASAVLARVNELIKEVKKHEPTAALTITADTGL
jgi:hypothetical protein